MRGRVALHKSQPDVVSDSLGDRSGCRSKWDWRLRRKNRINAKVIGPVDMTGIFATGVSGVWKNERNPVWPGARPLVPKRWSALVRKENLRVCIGGEGNKRMRLHEKK